MAQFMLSDGASAPGTPRGKTDGQPNQVEVWNESEEEFEDE